jgi:hypothetical protein
MGHLSWGSRHPDFAAHVSMVTSGALLYIFDFEECGDPLPEPLYPPFQERGWYANPRWLLDIEKELILSAELYRNVVMLI